MAADKHNQTIYKNILCTALLFSIVAVSLPVFCFSNQRDVRDPASSIKSKDTIAFLNFGAANPNRNSKVKAKSKQADVPCKEFNSRLQIGPNYTRVSLHPHGHQSFDGNLGGIQALYEYRPSNRFYGGLKFAWQEGTTHGHQGKRSLLYFDVHERLGYTFANEKRDWRLTLFSGFGYRFIGQKFHPKEGSSVHFNYDEFYFPVGFLTNHDFNCWFALGADFIWMPQVFSTVGIVPLKGAHWNLSSTVANYYVEVPFTFTLTQNRRVQLIFNPFYEHWQDGHSTAKLSNGTSLGIPGNTYNFYGISLNAAYSF